MFEGFSVPHYTQIPDELLDEWMSQLTGAEFKVVMFIARRTYGWRKPSDNISIQQMADGTGLNRDTCISAARSLADKGLIVATRNNDAVRGDTPTTYSLHIKQPPVSENPTPRVGKSDSQQTDNNANALLLGSDKKSPPKRKPDPMFDAFMTVCKLEPKTAGSFIGKYKRLVKDAGYTPAEVLRFGEIWYTREFPGGLKDGKAPSPASVAKYIGWVRETPAENQGVVVDYNDAILEALNG